jgi:LemA protein
VAPYVVAGVIALAVIALLLLAHNRFTHLRHGAESSWSDLDDALHARHDLVPKFVNLIRPYTPRERPIVDGTTSLRLTAMALQRTADAQTEAERALGAALVDLVALAERSPDLCLNTEFIALREQLARREDEIQTARHAYNGRVRRFNRLVRTFPTLVIARMFGFVAIPSFDLEPTVPAAAPRAEAPQELAKGA